MNWRAVGLWLGLSAAFSGPALADQTIVQGVTHVLYNGTADSAFVVGTARWGAAGCNPYYVEIAPTQAGRDKLLAIILAAQAGGRRLSFQGTCNVSNPDYFSAYYVTIQD